VNSTLHAIVRGRVQGVGFRHFVRGHAQELGLDGEVRNLEDGSVEIVATGTAQDLERLLDQVRTGPAGAFVTDVSVGYDSRRRQPRGFHIRR
jgi:acylphosphatase